MTGWLGGKLPPLRSGRAAPAQLSAIREGLSGAIASGMWRTDPPGREDTIGGVRVLHFAPPGTARATVLHFHGGGYRMGCPESMGPYAADLARRCEVEVICPAYRLAPEDPFPAGLTDGARVIEALCATEGPPLVLSGDSAGGGLAASLAPICVEQGVPLAGLVLHSPWLDLTVSSSSYDANGETDPLFSRASASDASALYLQGHDPRDPLASPLFAELSGFPPTLLTVGTGEVLLDDSVNFHARLEEAGIPASLVRIEGMEHVAVTRDRALTGAAEAFQATVEFTTGLLN